MRRRLLLTICGTVLVTLVLAGAGTLLLARFGATDATKRDLEGQSEALAQVFDELANLSLRPGSQSPPTVVNQALRNQLRLRMQALSSNLDIEDIGLLFGA